MSSWGADDVLSWPGVVIAIDYFLDKKINQGIESRGFEVDMEIAKTNCYQQVIKNKRFLHFIARLLVGSNALSPLQPLW